MVSLHGVKESSWPIVPDAPLIVTWPASAAPLAASIAVTVRVLPVVVRAPVSESTTGGAGGGATDATTVVAPGHETSARSCRNSAESPGWKVGDDPRTRLTSVPACAPNVVYWDTS